MVFFGLGIVISPLTNSLELNPSHKHHGSSPPSTTAMDRDEPLAVETSSTIKKIRNALSSIRNWLKQQQPLSVMLVDKLAMELRELELEVCHQSSPQSSLITAVFTVLRVSEMARIWAEIVYL